MAQNEDNSDGKIKQFKRRYASDRSEAERDLDGFLSSPKGDIAILVLFIASIVTIIGAFLH
jgi:hypothetical protein